VWCNVLQRVAVCCSVLKNCIRHMYKMQRVSDARIKIGCSELRYVAKCCSVLQCVAASCSLCMYMESIQINMWLYIHEYTNIYAYKHIYVCMYISGCQQYAYIHIGTCIWIFKYNFITCIQMYKYIYIKENTHIYIYVYIYIYIYMYIYIYIYTLICV